MFNNNQNYNNGYDTVALQRTVAGTMKRVYVKMTLGLIVTHWYPCSVPPAPAT